jgi:gamma-glutamyltranspeptidase/glutathione hydrolase
MPPPSSGGATLALTAHMLGTFDVSHLPWHGAGHVHLLAEAWKRAYADRNRYLADPDSGVMPLETLTSPVYGAWRAQGIVPGRPTSSAEVTPAVEAFARGRPGAEGARGGLPDTRPHPQSGETTHFSIVDAIGNAVAVTTTINSWYGSKVTVEGAGFLLNNDMDDFTSKPGTPNQFGLVQGEANAVAPGKRMLSAMTPSIVLDRDDRLSMVLGTPGGATITTTVFQTISNVLDHHLTLAQAVLAPRVHHQHLPDEITYEPGGLPDEVVAALRKLGHQVVERSELSGDVQAILRRPDGSLEGQSDPRRGGSAEGY